MINLDVCAAIGAEDQNTLNVIPDDEKSTAWNNRTNVVNAFKTAVMAHGLNVQNDRCVWCTLEIGEKGHRTAHRDHIAPKGKHGRWTFEPRNIAISCEYCNGFKVKGEVETVENVAVNYVDSRFLIVHPYLDDTAKHIQFVDNEDGHPIVIEGLTARGIWTIDTMQLASTYLTRQRAKDYIVAEAMKGLPQDVSDLITRARRGGVQQE